MTGKKRGWGRLASITEIRVRFCETDAVGHVNNVSYFIYLEQARVDFIKALLPDRSEKQWNIAVVSLHCDFLDQAYFDQVLTIRTAVKRIGTKSFTLSHAIVEKSAGKPIAMGESVVVLLDEEKKQAVPLDDMWVGELKKHLEGDAKGMASCSNS
jgi:acyl-CoA thioester hydrolase